MISVTRFLLLLFIFIWASFSGWAQKTDMVILTNGDILTGEIKKLDLDILQLKTPGMSTVQIKWGHVSNIYAPDKYCEFQLKNKVLIYGNLDTIKMKGALRVTSEMGEYNIPTTEVVTIIQVKQEVWNRFSGSIGAGISYTKASQVMQGNYNAHITYKDKVKAASLDINSIETSQPDRPTTSKKDYFLRFDRTTYAAQFASVWAGFQENTELGIELRKIGGMGYGIDFLHSAVARIRISAGATGNEETTLENHATTRNAEGILSLDTRVFKYTGPEIYLNANVNWYPSMTVVGRHRFEIEFNIKFELVSNLFLQFQFYENLDNKPASESAAKQDYGILSGLSYTFGL